MFEWRSRCWSFLLKLSPDRPSPTIQAQPSSNVGPFHWENSRLRVPELPSLLYSRPLSQLARQADIVFPKAKVAVFVDGCFWHGCAEPGKRVDQTNGWYWPEKIERNRARDRDTDAHLAAAGWETIRVWEHDDATAAAKTIKAAIKNRTMAATSLTAAVK